MIDVEGMEPERIQQAAATMNRSRPRKWSVTGNNRLIGMGRGSAWSAGFAVGDLVVVRVDEFYRRVTIMRAEAGDADSRRVQRHFRISWMGVLRDTFGWDEMSTSVAFEAVRVGDGWVSARVPKELPEVVMDYAEFSRRKYKKE
jgi:hypothetical protein